MRVETAPYLLYPVFCKGAGQYAGRSVDRATLTRAGAEEVVSWLWANREKLGAAMQLAGTKTVELTIIALWNEFEEYHRSRHSSDFDFDAVGNVVSDVLSQGNLSALKPGSAIDWSEFSSNAKYATAVLLPAYCAGVGKRAGYAQWEYGWLYWGGTGLIDLLWWYRERLEPPGPPGLILDFTQMIPRDRVLAWTRWMLQRLFPEGTVGVRWSQIVEYLDRLASAPSLAVPTPSGPSRSILKRFSR